MGAAFFCPAVIRCGSVLGRWRWRCPCSSSSSSSSFGLAAKQREESTRSLCRDRVCVLGSGPAGRTLLCSLLGLAATLSPRASLAKLLYQPLRRFWEHNGDHLLTTPTSTSNQIWPGSNSVLSSAARCAWCLSCRCPPLSSLLTQ